ncbi:hypothetical protein [Adlercreutzia sp. ZJ304]|uniref:hypothetical protein n=1 Tax=Adlercreutzia sp. ZJ304 TaxID=2709791 RepID=UPI0013EBD9BE|nr:hypothetical protein [Adlercreutzia sp. ZJ304]
MCIAFTTRDVLDYMLSGNDETEGIGSVSEADLVMFCKALEKGITAHFRVSPHYKYVYYDLDIPDVLSCADGFKDRYRVFGGEISFANKPDRSTGCVIENQRNDEIVVAAMRDALRALSGAKEKGVA